MTRDQFDELRDLYLVMARMAENPERRQYQVGAFHYLVQTSARGRYWDVPDQMPRNMWVEWAQLIDRLVETLGIDAATILEALTLSQHDHWARAASVLMLRVHRSDVFEDPPRPILMLAPALPAQPTTEPSADVPPLGTFQPRL